MAKKMKKETKESAAKKVKENNKSVLQNEPIFRFDRNNACMIVEFEDGKQITIQFSGLEFAAFLLKVTNEIYCSKNNIKKRYRLDDLGNKLQEFHKLLENIDTEWLIAFKRSARFQENSNTTQDARWALSEARRKMREEFEKLGIAKEEADSLVAKILPGWNDEMEYPVDKIKLEGADPFLEAAKGQLVFKEYGVILSKDRTEIKLIPDGIEGEFKIPETVTKLEGDIFKKCKKITSILIPDSVISINNYVFSGCEKLESIEVAKENPVYKSINGMLLNKEGTELILVPKGIKGDLHIPEGVTEIGKYTSYKCTGLTSITIPKSVIKITGFGSKESIWDNPFRDCNRLKRIEVAEGNPVYKSINGMLLNKEGMELIYVPEGIKGNLQIPEGVKMIGERVFYNCTGLTSITIPKSVTEIGWDPFSGCTGLENIEVVEENPVYKSVDGMLLNKKGMELIYVPKRIKGELQIPKCVCRIGYDAFGGCTGLTSIIIPKGVIEIGESAFHHCTGLTSIIIPEGVIEISWNAFCGCTGLTSIIIPESVGEIGEGAFAGCDSLEEVYFRGDEPVIEAPRDKNGELWNEKNLFSDDHNKNLKLYYRKGTKDWSGTFDGLPVEVKKDAVLEKEGIYLELYDNKTAAVQRGKIPLTGDVIVPSVIEYQRMMYLVTEIGSHAFKDHTGLTSITIPESVTKIGYGAFYGCTGLTSIIIPKGVTEIRSDAFSGCTSLKKIYFEGNAPELGLDVFENVHATVYYRKGTKGWKETLGGLPTQEMD